MSNKLLASSLAVATLVAGGSLAAIGPVAGASPAGGRPVPATSHLRLPSDPGRYSADLVRAWGRGDRAAVARYATSGAARALFRYASPGGRHWVANGCQGALGTQHCLFVDRHRHVELDLQGPTDGFGRRAAHVVDAVTFRRVR